MGRNGLRAAVLAALLALGFSVASIASGGSPLAVLTGTTTTTATQTATTTTTTSTSRKVLMCHRTHSKKKPFVTISIDQHAVPAHLRLHDLLGPCTPARIKLMKSLHAKKLHHAKAHVRRHHRH